MGNKGKCFWMKKPLIIGQMSAFVWRIFREIPCNNAHNDRKIRGNGSNKDKINDSFQIFMSLLWYANIMLNNYQHFTFNIHKIHHLHHHFFPLYFTTTKIK